jgi:hypothetical protein
MLESNHFGMQPPSPRVLRWGAYFFWICLAATAAAPKLHAQSTATLNGMVLDPSGAAVAGAAVTLENNVTGYRARTETRQDGSFTFSNIPFHSYVVLAERTGFEPGRETLSLRTNIPTDLTIKLKLAGSADSVTVSAGEQDLLVNPEETGTHMQMNQKDIEELPIQAGNRGIEAILVTFPGFAQNANGAIHPRGAHNQMTFVIDGMPISDQLTGAFANSLDPNIVQTVELFTGNVPAEYGSKVSAVANLTTKSGLNSGRSFSGSATLSAAQFDTLGGSVSVAGGNDKLGYSAIINLTESHRFLDQVSLENWHNGGNSERGFVRLDYNAGAKDNLRLNLMSGRSSFQLANLKSQQFVGMDQRQQLEDVSIALGWVHTFNATTTLDSTTSYRSAISQLFPSPHDIPVTASQSRHLSTFFQGTRVSSIRGRHNLRGGIDIQLFPVSENFVFGITSPLFNIPGTEGYNPNVAPHDLTRGGTPFVFSKKDSGGLYSGFFQDNFKAGNWFFSLGLRFDSYHYLSSGNQLQPRVGVTYQIKKSNTVLRASYSRLYQTPPNENLLLSNSPQAATISPPAVIDQLGGYQLIISEKQDFIEAGLQQALGRYASLDVNWYHKQSRNLQDNNNFLNTGIIFPISLSQIRVNGLEARVVMTPYKGFTVTGSLTHYHAVATPPFTGGLYIGNDAISALTAGPFVIDHDQVLAAQAIVNYSSNNGFFTTLTTRYDSGLVCNPSDPLQVALDPDYSDLLPYVKLVENPPRVKGRTILDVVAGYQHTSEGKRRWEVSGIVSNITDKIGLYNFQSAFVGTRLVQPRTFGARLRFYF